MCVCAHAVHKSNNSLAFLRDQPQALRLSPWCQQLMAKLTIFDDILAVFSYL